MIDQILVDDLNYPTSVYIKKGQKIIVFSFKVDQIWSETPDIFSLRKNKKELKEVLVSSLRRKVLERHKALMEALSIEVED